MVAEKRQVKRNTRQAKQNFNSCCALSLLTEPHARLYLFYFKSIESLYLDLWMWLPRHFIWQQLHQSNQVSTWAINNIWGLFSYMLAKAEEHQWTKLKLVTSLKFESFFFLVGWFCNSRALYKGILQPGKSDLPPNYVTDQCEVKNKNNKKKSDFFKNLIRLALECLWTKPLSSVQRWKPPNGLRTQDFLCYQTALLTTLPTRPKPQNS